MNWRRWLKVVVVAIAVAVYLNIGVLVGNLGIYSKYYPRSQAAKVLNPSPPVDFLDSPFDERTPEIDESLESKYGSFETYRFSSDVLKVKVLMMIVWPIFIFWFYAVATVSWIGFLVWKFVLLLWWLFKGVYLGGFLESLIYPSS